MSISLAFLLECSMKSLEDLELNSLNRAANLSKAARTELDEWVEQLAQAKLARWLMENRHALVAVQGTPGQGGLFEVPKREKTA